LVVVVLVLVAHDRKQKVFGAQTKNRLDTKIVLGITKWNWMVTKPVER
jgi:hypothetical protein